MKALAIGTLAGLAAMLVLAPATGGALGTLARARAERDRLAAEAANPEAIAPLLATGLGLGARDASAGRATMAARVQTLAKAGGVLIEESAPVAAPARIAALRLRVSGAEKAVLAFADALERGRPLVRLRRWRVEPIAGGVRLTGEAVSAWQ
ncbi:hypothetical protein [Sphingomonas hengshuiensis]|uniref:Type II secretion system protein M n=1 Tax=Sphingomonas hengshuiensis TaxID=1609977 RepID=A0A7U4J8J6_9SPHN|nr:hypothetical protein [Sphingomonas hengshuiensis]AJP72173.1 hypothetical protein TS85_10815 [Sphingomonas hengshuiensis]